MDEKTTMAAAAPAAEGEERGGDSGAAALSGAPSVVDDQTGVLIPTAGQAQTSSYSMLEPRMKKVYGAYYKELYYTPERRVLDAKVQELISIAASLVAKTP